MISEIVAALIAAGATPEMILAAVRAAEASQTDALGRRRAADRERQARHRERNVTKRDVTPNNVTNVTDRDKRDEKERSLHSKENKSSLPSLRSVSADLDERTEAGARDFAENAEPAAKPTAIPKAKAEPKPRASRCPADFWPDPAGMAICDEAGMRRDDIAAEVDAMIDWSRSAPQGVKLDWQATWRGWIRRKLTEQPRNAQRNRTAASADRGPSAIVAGMRNLADKMGRGGQPGDPADGTVDDGTGIRRFRATPY